MKVIERDFDKLTITYKLSTETSLSVVSGHDAELLVISIKEGSKHITFSLEEDDRMVLKLFLERYGELSKKLNKLKEI